MGWEKYAGLINRALLHSLLLHKNTKEVQILLGIRRSGKSTLLKLFINELLNKKLGKSILYINFDDPNYYETWKNASLIYRIIEEAEKITSEKIQYLFLDEIQNVEAWEKFVKSIYDSSVLKKIFVTGSNSSLLEGNYTKMLSGRYIAHYVYPLSFDEIKRFEKINNQINLLQNKSKIKALAENVLHYGSFLEIFKQKQHQVKEDILISYFETILLKDCIVSKNIRGSRTFNGFLVPYDKPDALAKVLQIALEDDKLIDSASAKNLKIIENNFSEDVVRPRIIDMYKQIYTSGHQPNR